MYVCICNAVSDRDIRAAHERGIRSLEALSLELGVGAGCGCCRDAAREYISVADNCGAGHAMARAGGAEENEECKATRRYSHNSTAS